MTDTELHNLCELCAKEIEKRIIEPDKNEITNGDRIKALFPDIAVLEHESTVDVINLDRATIFTKEWWNAPYNPESGDKGMRVQLVIEYMNGDKEEIYCDDYSEGKIILTYYIRFGENEGEYHIPYSSIKRWSAHRF